MKISFDEFFNILPNYKCYRESLSAKLIYEDILSKEENIKAMIEYANNNRPALLACIKQVEKYFDSIDDKSFDLNQNHPKQALGSMVKAILMGYGYESYIQREFPKNTSKYVHSSMCYHSAKRV
jgi:hypothetical protein